MHSNIHRRAAAAIHMRPDILISGAVGHRHQDLRLAIDLACGFFCIVPRAGVIYICWHMSNE